MGPRALLLSPDDQAVNAITGVLEEISVNCERPLDGASAAKKLNSERFDLVLVDCDNLPAAKLIFDVCRRSHGTATVPVAIVDGRVGLPTAFRLGAELILTKPVSKDQARITIRTAVSRIKKDQPVPEATPADGVRDVEASLEQEQESVAPKALAMAAAAGASSNPIIQAVAPAIATGPASVASSDPIPAEPPEPSTIAAPVSTPVMSSTPALSAAAAEMFEMKPVVVTEPEPAMNAAASPTSSESRSSSATFEGDTASEKSEKEVSEDPVMQALERNEPSSPSPIFSAYEEPKQRRDRGGLVTVLVLAIAGAAFYGAWMYQRGFREFVQARLSQASALLGPQIQRVVGATGKSTAAAPSKPATVPAIPPPSAPAAASARGETAVATAPTPTGNIPEAQMPPAAGSAPSTTASSFTATNGEPVMDDQKKIAGPGSSQNDVPDAKNSVLLSSKGAEKRLMHRVAPVIPAAARAQSAEATVVLKAVIDENGAVKALQPVEGDPVLADAAVKAVKQWRYKPYMRDGKAIAFQTIVLVDFQ